MSKALKEERLPVQQLAILSIARFAEPVALTSVFPYLPEMIESFDVPPDEVAKWAGLTSAAFSVSQCLTAMFWVRASDRLGRKVVIMASLACTMGTVLLLGFSQSLAWAIVARALGGAANGNVGIIRTTVAELVPQKSMQPRAFSVMPLVWSIGSVFGPILGGALASPAKKFPDIFGDSEFFKRYPFALPNIVASTLFITGIITGILFLKETMATKKNDRDNGLLAGKFLLGLFRRQKDRKTSWTKDIDQASPLLKASAVKSLAPPPRASYRQVFSYQSSINLLVYFLLSVHAVAFDQLIPVFLHLPHSPTDASLYTEGLPIKFANGFGLDSGRIGKIFTIYGITTMLVQFFIFPPLARRYGVLTCLRVCTFAFPISYTLMPFTVLLPTTLTRQIAAFLVMSIKGFAGVFAYPCNTILMTNSASSIPVLNTLNGVAVSISAVGRALGPWVGGMAFSYGVESGWGILPWWFLAASGVANHVSTWWLVEGEGIKSEEDEDSEPSTPLVVGDDGDDGVLESKHAVNENLLSDSDVDSLTHNPTQQQQQHKSPISSLKRGHKRNQSSVTVAEHGEDPELALEMQDLSQQHQQITVGISERINAGVVEPKSAEQRSRGEKSKEEKRDRGGEKEAMASGSTTLAAPAFKTRLRSPVGRRESLG